MIHIRIIECGPCKSSSVLYREAKTYPIKVSEGHLLNLRILKPESVVKVPAYDTPLLSCLLYASIHFYTNRGGTNRNPAYDIYWGQQSLTICDGGTVELARGFDLLCDIQIRGGTFASMGTREFSWDPILTRWTIPVLSQKTPLFLLGKEGAKIKMDGEAVYARVGIVGNNKLRSEINRSIHKEYSDGYTWY